MKNRCSREEFKKIGEELQQFLAFRRKGFAVPSKKGKGSYNRRKFKKGVSEDDR